MYILKLPLGDSDSSLFFTSHRRTIEIVQLLMVLFQLWSTDHLHQHYLEVCKKCTYSGPILEQLKQQFRDKSRDTGFNKVSGKFGCMLKFEKH